MKEHTLKDKVNNPFIGMREIGGQDSVLDLVVFRGLTLSWRLRKTIIKFWCQVQTLVKQFARAF